MGHSIQDVDSRLKTIEDKVDFLMKSFQMTNKTTGEQTNLLDVYRSIKTSGLIVEAS